ncbi:MAG: bifunctional metallophosphatase/5'-nucleotidase [Gammaproteobacteria bacterium]|nr:bifunctional metallophosphatase/5'-nucleotidase [Gammaproteobacteria bacterium]
MQGSALAAHQHDERNFCGHIDHDGPEERAQASARTFWRDDHAANPESWVRFKILGFNDFHGQLEPRYLSFAKRYAGGAAVFASYLEAAAASSKHGAIIVHAGDQVGASPPISALLQDEPSISFLNMLANKYCMGERKDHDDRAEGRKRDPRMNPRCNLVGTVGNHEFDEGVSEMLRLINGGIHAKGPFLDPNYDGAHFPYVSANVVWADSGKPVLPPYVIKRIHGQRIAFIGAVLKETPTIVTPTGVAGVRFLDEAEAINRYIPEIKRQGVRAIVVTIHQGTNQASYNGPTNTDPQDVGGDIGPIINNLDDEVDIVVAGHWHQFTNALMPNKHGKLILVTQAFSYATAYDDIDVAIDPKTRDIVEKSAQIVTTWTDEGPGLTPNPQVAALVAQASERVAPLVNRVIGTASGDILRSENSAGESAMGNLIADAQRKAMGTDLAFMNPGGIRADLLGGDVTWGDVFTVQPFNNDLVRMDLTGAQIITLLSQQWVGQTSPRILKTSGIQYRWNPAATADQRVDVSSILINGNPIDPAAVYSVTVNSFMAAGGDNFTVLTAGVNRVIGPVDLDALISFIQSLPQPFTAAIEGRIQLTQ